MPEPHHDATHHQPGDSDDAHDATVLPFPRRPGEATRPSTREGRRERWRVVRIDTEPMTAQHYDQAVTTLATLITRWKQNHSNASEIHKKSA